MCNNRSQEVVFEGTLYFEGIGFVTAVLLPDRLSWHLAELDDEVVGNFCWGRRDTEKTLGQVPISEVFASELCEMSTPTSASYCGMCGGLHSPPLPQMYRFAVHTFQRVPDKKCRWIPKVYTFSHENGDICQAWVTHMRRLLDHDVHRPKSLLVLVNPFGGTGTGAQTWESVAPLFELARVRTKVILTERAGHAHDLMARASEENLKAQDGVVAVGGDGLFNEVLNGLLTKWHRGDPAPKPQWVSEMLAKAPRGGKKWANNITEGQEKLANDSIQDGAGLPSLADVSKNSSGITNIQLRIGIIPAGSTDTVAISTTGCRDPITAALHILLGDSMPLDVVRITSWKKSPESGDEPPEVRYAASFAGYGFYGDVMKESESTRWMGPARYDVAGAKVLMKHKKYVAEVSFLEMPTNVDAQKEVVCRENCFVCSQAIDLNHLVNDNSNRGESSAQQPPKPTWRTKLDSFHSIGAAVMSCRNDKAPDGLSAHAHLADGLLHLILIKSCSRPNYLRQLITLTRRGADPLDFDFVEHYKTPAFTFTSHGEESIWNVDGELFPAHQLSGQCFRGLVNVFARGPEF